MRYKLVAAILALTVAAIYGTSTVHALQQECLVTAATVFSNAPDNNDLQAQTFIASGSYQVGAVKLNIHRVAGDATMNVYITATSGVSPNAAPDMNTILGQEQFTTNLLPEFDLIDGSNNVFSCDPLVDAAQYVIFDPPVSVTSGVQYGLVIDYASGDVSVAAWPWQIADNPYANGNSWECLVPASCSRLTPATWDFTNGQIDTAFAVYDDIIVPPLPPSAERWLENFLRDFLGLDSTAGKMLFAMGFLLVLMVGLLYMGIPPMVALAAGFFGAGAGTLALLISPAVFLAMFAVAGMGLLFAVTIGRSSGGMSDG